MRLRFIPFAFVLILGWLCAAAGAQSHSVSLTWTASTDSGVSYNVYRLSGACPTSGTAGFSKITTATITATAYTDTTATPGDYCYYATSVLNGAESIPSNMASAVILPAPPTSLSVTAAN